MTTATTSKKVTETGILSNEKFPLENRSLHLAIEVRENELLSCLLDKHSNRYIAFNKNTLQVSKNNLEELFKQDILSNRISSTSISFNSNSSILIPTPFFKKELLNGYLGFQQLDRVNETPCFDHIKNLDSYNLYTVNNDIISVMRKHYPNASFRHNSSIFIEYILIEHKHNQESKVFVSVLSGSFDVVVIKAGRLILHNRFNYSGSSDFIYYLLWVYEQLGLDNEKTPCILYGEIENTSEPYKEAAKYIKKLSMGGRNEQSGYADALSSLPPHRYRSLFTQYLCV